MLALVHAATFLAFLWGVADRHVTVGPLYLGERYEDIRSQLGDGTHGKLCEKDNDPKSCVETLSYGDDSATAILQFDPGAPSHNLTSVTIVLQKSNAVRLTKNNPIARWSWEGKQIGSLPSERINGWQSGVATGRKQLMGYRRFDSAHTFQAIFYIDDRRRVRQFVVAMLG